MANYTSNKHFVEALETLSSIASLELESPVVIQEKHEHTVGKSPLQYRTVHWLHHTNKDKIVHVVKGTFRTVLGYLREFYRKEFNHLGEHNAYESIQNMMALVVQAAKKLDRFSHEILGARDASVKESQEYRDLHAFYQRKVAPLTLQESLLSSMKMLPVKAVIEASKQHLGPHDKAGHVYIDLETVKNDGEYELFSIRQEDGSRFMSPRLLKSIEVVAHLNQHISDEVSREGFQALKKWQDHLARFAAQNILLGAHEEIDEHIKAIHQYQESTFGMLVYQAIQALFLAAHADPHAPTLKNHSDYLFDFQKFIREALLQYNSVDFEVTKRAAKARHLIDVLMSLFFQGYSVNHELAHFMELPEVEDGKATTFSAHLERAYDSYVRNTKSLDYAPLMKVLHALEVRNLRGFDPYMMQNMPTELFEIKQGNSTTPVYRLPTPTYQEYIHKAACIEEFKAYIKNLGRKKHLIFNLQDRTSLREYARANALENFASSTPNLISVTMTKASDFYEQTGPYSNLNQTNLFIEQLLDHTQSESAGYFYPDAIKNALFPDFAANLAKTIHRVFFQGQNVLARSARLDFIELYYTFMQLKIVDLVDPYSMSIACKDGLDISLTQGCESFVLMHLIQGKPLLHAEELLFENALFKLPLVVRGRNLFQQRFQRMTHLIRHIELLAEGMGYTECSAFIRKEFGPLFNGKIFKSSAVIV